MEGILASVPMAEQGGRSAGAVKPCAHDVEASRTRRAALLLSLSHGGKWMLGVSRGAPEGSPGALGLWPGPLEGAGDEWSSETDSLVQ